MVINKEDVLQIAELSRLEVAEEDIDKFTEQIGNILGYVEVLNDLDTDGIEPTSHAMEVSNVFREDEVVKFEDKDLIINNGPLTDQNAFVVPKIV